MTPTPKTSTTEDEIITAKQIRGVILKRTQLTRAEYLSEDTLRHHGIDEKSGLVIVETRLTFNDDEKFIPLSKHNEEKVRVFNEGFDEGKIKENYRINQKLHQLKEKYEKGCEKRYIAYGENAQPRCRRTSYCPSCKAKLEVLEEMFK